MNQIITRKISYRPYLFTTLMTGHVHLQSACLPIEERNEFMIRNGFAIPEGNPIMEVVDESNDGISRRITVYKDEYKTHSLLPGRKRF